MPASRWQTSMSELFEWIGQDDEENEIACSLRLFRRGQEGEPGDAAKSDGEPPKYPDVLPILPLRGVVVYPQTAVPLTVGQPWSSPARG